MSVPSPYAPWQRPLGPGPGQPAEPHAIPWLLPNPDDDPAVHALLESDDARARGILLVRLSPTSITVTHLVRDTLRALGLPHKIDHLDIPEQLPRLLTYRLCGLGITVLAIDCPHPLHPNQLRCARRWCDHLNAQLVLITTEPNPVNPAAGLTTSATALLHRTPRPRHDYNPDAHLIDPDLAAHAAQLVGVSLPGDEFTTFRTSCLKLLPQHAETIDALYTSAYHRASNGTHNQPRRTSTTDRSGDNHLPDHVARAHAAVFHALTLGDPTASIRLIRLRATQAALFTHHRVLLRWNPPIPTHAPHTALPGSLTPRAHTTVLEHDLNPTKAIRTLLAGLFELSWRQERALREDQVRLDPPALTCGNLELRIPAWATPFLYAHHCARQHHNPHRDSNRDSGLCFPDHLDDRSHILGLPRVPIYQPVDGAQRLHPTDEIFTSSPSPHHPPPAANILDNWLRRRHLTITPLAIPATET